MLFRINRDKDDPDNVGGSTNENAQEQEVPDEKDAQEDQEHNHKEDPGVREEETPRHDGDEEIPQNFFRKNWLWVLLSALVLIALSVAIINWINNHPTPTPTPSVTAPAIAPVDTTGTAAAQAHADSLAAAQAHADSLDTARYNYESAMRAKVEKKTEYSHYEYGASEKGSKALSDSIIVFLGNEYNRILGDDERDPNITLYENGLGIKNQPRPANPQTTQRLATTPNPAVTNHTPANYRVVKVLPRGGHTTNWREWRTNLSWGTMGGDVNVEGSFNRNISSIPDETPDFHGCSVQIPKAIKDSLVVLRQRAIETRDNPTFVTYESFNNRVISGISSGMIWGGTRNDKIQKIDSAPINVRITHVMKGGNRVPISTINAKVYKVVLTTEQARAMNLPGKFIPPAGKTKVVFKIYFFGDGFGDIPQCNNICWQSYFE